MASIQERLQRKREPLDKWSIREQLCLSFAVAKVGDQNWMSVSRSLKPFGEGRPADWFHQKNCAAQYGALLENIDTPKRKKRSSGVDALESPSEMILKKLIQERMAEMKKEMEREKAEYKKLQEEMTLLRSGTLSEEQLDAMCKQIEEEEQQKENEAIAHAQWLKEREIRKAEIERAWRPTIKINPPNTVQTGQKRKASDSIDSVQENDNELKTPVETPTKPALSPLLTSLLKSPSHSQNVTTSSILHSAITNTQRPTTSTSSPTIASLLNSSASVQVSPGIQHLVSTAIAQEPTPPAAPKDPIDDLLENADANLVEDIENSILSVGDGDLPEIKNEEVEVFISDLIENADIVNDPEKHLLDGDDIISNLESELEELDNKEKAEMEAEKEKEKEQEKEKEIEIEIEKEIVLENEKIEKVEDETTPKVESQSKPIVSTENKEFKNNLKEPEIDPFEFQEDPEYDVKLSRSSSNSVQTISNSLTPQEVQIDSPAMESLADSEDIISEQLEEETIIEEKVKTEDIQPILKKEIDVGGSVEIVELAMSPVEIGTDLDKTQIRQIVHSSKTSIETPKEEIPIATSELTSTSVKSPEKSEELTQPELKNEAEIKIEEKTNDEEAEAPVFSPEDIYDENIEVTKIDKSKAKRDYSRTKKKEESDFDILLAVEQAVNATIEEEVDSSSEHDEPKKLEPEMEIPKPKLEPEQSNSPWTEEEPEQEPEPEQEVEQDNVRPNTRRYSTPATPIDSVPNSPASSYFEDDNRSCKKALMLVYSRLSNHKYASLFQRPITNEQAPGYHKMVKRAMDLSTIKKNIESGAVRTTYEFKRDVLLMFNNAIMYNKTDDTVYNMTMEIQKEAVEQINFLLAAQTDNASGPARRETRTSEGPGSKRKRDSESLQVQSKSKKRKED